MVAVGFGVLWFAYTVGIYGYCLVKGYQVGFTDLFHAGGWPNPKQKNQNTPVSTGKTATVPGSGTGTLGKGVA